MLKTHRTFTKHLVQKILYFTIGFNALLISGVQIQTIISSLPTLSLASKPPALLLKPKLPTKNVLVWTPTFQPKTALASLEAEVKLINQKLSLKTMFASLPASIFTLNQQKYHYLQNILRQKYQSQSDDLIKQWQDIQTFYLTHSEGYSYQSQIINPGNIISAPLSSLWPDFDQIKEYLASDLVSIINKQNLIQHWKDQETDFATEQTKLLDQDLISCFNLYLDPKSPTDLSQTNLAVENAAQSSLFKQPFYSHQHFLWYNTVPFFLGHDGFNQDMYLYDDTTTNQVWALLDLNGYYLWVLPTDQPPSFNQNFIPKLATGIASTAYFFTPYSADPNFSNFFNPQGYGNYQHYLQTFYQLNAASLSFQLDPNTKQVISYEFHANFTFTIFVNYMFYKTYTCKDTHLNITGENVSTGNVANHFALDNPTAKTSYRVDNMHVSIANLVITSNNIIYRYLAPKVERLNNALLIDQYGLVNQIFNLKTSTTIGFNTLYTIAAQTMFCPYQTGIYFTQYGNFPLTMNGTINPTMPPRIINMVTPKSGFLIFGTDNFANAGVNWNQMLPMPTNFPIHIFPTPPNPVNPPWTPVAPGILGQKQFNFSYSIILLIGLISFEGLALLGTWFFLFWPNKNKNYTFKIEKDLKTKPKAHWWK